MNLQNITLIGLPTAGKSKLGKELRKYYGYIRIDGDKDILIPSIGNLQEFIENKGEREFLALEEKLFLEYTFEDVGQVISPGGSIVYSEAVMHSLKKISTVIYLELDFDYFKSKEKKLRERGVIGFRDKTLKQLYMERNELCEEYSDFKLNLTKRDFEFAAKEIYKRVN